jgi:NAD+-dependent farnesol dehydrogenase
MISLVTGGTGYLGSRLVETLLRQGDEVRVLHRPTSDVCRLSGAVSLVEGDVTQVDSLMLAAEGCDRIFHSAALVRTWSRDPREFHRTNVEGTSNVCRTAEATRCRLVYTSSVLALGPTGPDPVGEDRASPERHFCTEYERTKTQADGGVREFLGRGLDAVILYPGLVYGPGPLTQGNFVSILVRDFLRGRVPAIPGKGTQRWTFSFIDDVVHGHIAAAGNAPAGKRYILGGPVCSVDEAFGTLARITSGKAPSLHLPVSLMKCIGWAGEMLAGFTGRPPSLTRGVAETHRHHWAYDSTAAVKELGYRWRPLEEGLAEILKYLEGFLA